MSKKVVVTWFVISIICLLIGRIVSFPAAPYLSILGLISSMQAAGYYAKPDHPVFGTIFYGCVIVIVVGVCFKVSHFTGDNILITVGLLGTVITYGLWWWKTPN